MTKFPKATNLFSGLASSHAGSLLLFAVKRIYRVWKSGRLILWHHTYWISIWKINLLLSAISNQHRRENRGNHFKFPQFSTLTVWCVNHEFMLLALQILFVLISLKVIQKTRLWLLVIYFIYKAISIFGLAKFLTVVYRSAKILYFCH